MNKQNEADSTKKKDLVNYIQLALDQNENKTLKCYVMKNISMFIVN